MINVDTNNSAFVNQSQQVEGTKENLTTTKTKGVFESFRNKVRQAGSSVKGLAGRVKDAIVRNKRVALIITGIALWILGVALTPVTFGGSMALACVGGGMIGFNAVRLYQEKNGIPTIFD